MSGTRTIHFNALPEPVRERLVKCFSGEGMPGPIVSDAPGSGGAIFGWIVVLLIGLGGVGLFVLADFGHFYNVTQEWPFTIAYVISFFLAIYGLLAVVRKLKTKSAYPYTPGRYLFPLDFIDARDEKLKITPMRDLEDFRGVHHHTNGSYTHTMLHFHFTGGKVESFHIAGRARAQEIMDALANQQRVLKDALEAQQYDVLGAMDPLVDARLSDAWETYGPELPPGTQAIGGTLAGSVPGFLKWASIPALILAILIGPAAWYGRNLASDEVALEETKARDTEDGYKTHLYGCWSHKKVIREKLMPRAAFREAKDKDSVTAMRDFLERYPKAGYKKKARKHIGKLYDKAYKEFKKQASKENPEMLPFMKDLLDYLEDNGTPDVKVRFRSPDEGELKAVDAVNKGDITPASPYFTRERNKVREDIIATGLQRGLGSIFPQDILSLEKGKQLGKKSKKKIKEPTIEVRYEVGPSGQIYESDKSKRAFTGILIKFDVKMRVPKRKKSLDFDLSVQPPERFRVSYTTLDTFGTGGLDSGPSDGQVYDVMAARAFEQLNGKLRSIFFREGSKAFKDADVTKRP